MPSYNLSSDGGRDSPLELLQSALRRFCHARQRILLAITLDALGLMSWIAMMHYSSSSLKGGWRLTAAPVCLLHGKVTVPGVRFIDSTNRGWPNVIFEAHRTALGFVSTWAYYCWEVYILYTVSSFFLQPRLSSSSECHTSVCWVCHFSITGCCEFGSNCCLSSLWPLLSVYWPPGWKDGIRLSWNCVLVIRLPTQLHCPQPCHSCSYSGCSYAIQLRKTTVSAHLFKILQPLNTSSAHLTPAQMTWTDKIIQNTSGQHNLTSMDNTIKFTRT